MSRKTEKLDDPVRVDCHSEVSTGIPGEPRTLCTVKKLCKRRRHREEDCWKLERVEGYWVRDSILARLRSEGAERRKKQEGRERTEGRKEGRKDGKKEERHCGEFRAVPPARYDRLYGSICIVKSRQ